MVANLGYKLFFIFAAINICVFAIFAMLVDLFGTSIVFMCFFRLLPETKGRSLEEMDIIFGAVSFGAREAFIEKQERELVLEFTGTEPGLARRGKDSLRMM